jgi:hypothetical protein
MTNQNPDPDQNPLLNPKFGLNTDTPDVKGFLTWLFDPEVDKAFEQFDRENDTNEN